MENYQTNKNWEELSQDLFNRLDTVQKLKILEYIGSPKHEITLERELK